MAHRPTPIDQNVPANEEPSPQPRYVSVIPLQELKYRLRGMIESGVQIPGTESTQAVIDVFAVRQIYDKLREIIDE